ncbi:MAG: hypothetical protein K2G37_04945 [Clostridia bacterium]|nr:hypothetical protein [Clostridia bacterium]MDE7328567.1 hypothetical protein [Clostridia bacterium]
MQKRHGNNSINNNIHKNHRERMRQRIRKDGIESLHDHELLEYLLYAYIPRKDTNPIAHNLINLAGSLEKVFNLPPQVLESVPNMTKTAALFLSSMSGIIKRYEDQKAEKKITFANSEETMLYFKKLFGDEPEEQLYVALIAPSGQLVDISKVGNGTTDQCKLDIKKLLLKMTNLNAKEVIVAHNHPSGNPNPSMSDFEFTKWLVSFFASVEMNLVDHIIVAKGGYYSFRLNGVISAYSDDYKKYCETTFADKFKK